MAEAKTIVGPAPQVEGWGRGGGVGADLTTTGCMSFQSEDPFRKRLT